MKQASRKPTHRPPARKLRDERSPLPLSGSSANQVGRVRAWLSRNGGLLCLGIGWVFALGIVFIPKGDATAVIELGFAGSVLLGFGVGWILRDLRGKR